MTDAYGFVPPERCTAATVRPYEWNTFWELWALRKKGELLPRANAIPAPRSGMTWMGLVVHAARSGRLAHVWPRMDKAAMEAVSWCSFCGCRGHVVRGCTADPFAPAAEVVAARAACPRPAFGTTEALLRGIAASYDAEAAAVAASQPTSGVPQAGPGLVSRPRKPAEEESVLSTRGKGKRRAPVDGDSSGDEGAAALMSRVRARGRPSRLSQGGAAAPGRRSFDKGSPNRVADGRLFERDRSWDRDRDGGDKWGERKRWDGGGAAQEWRGSVVTDAVLGGSRGRRMLVANGER